MGFGIDVIRYNDCLDLSKNSGLSFIYVVRHVDNPKDRNFIGWRWILFSEFKNLANSNDIKNGGVGMGTIGYDNPTIMLAYEHFKKFKN